ncbi:hypothetical protein Q1695_015373 [Nippostrongylus brasiliensis]|nr:hypothetical protein Q1695_015373 [Nippostrongylus brasiliensis]
MADNQYNFQISQHGHSYARVSSKQKEILVKLVFVEGKSTSEAATIAAIHESTARNIVNAYKTDGEILERPIGGIVGTDNGISTPGVIVETGPPSGNNINDQLDQYERRLQEIQDELCRLDKESKPDSNRADLLAEIECELQMYGPEFQNLRNQPNLDSTTRGRLDDLESSRKGLLHLLHYLQNQPEPGNNINDQLDQYERRLKEIENELSRMEKEPKPDSNRADLLAEIECELEMYEQEFQNLRNQPNLDSTTRDRLAKLENSRKELLERLHRLKNQPGKTLTREEKRERAIRNGWSPCEMSSQKLYLVERQPSTHSEAADFCRSKEGQLATIHSSEERTCIWDVSRENRSGITQPLDENNWYNNLLWIGLERKGNNWQWIDGSQLDLSLWAVNEPKEKNDPPADCGEMNQFEDLKLPGDGLEATMKFPNPLDVYSVNCNRKLRGYICEMDISK